ncbi:MAG TPA: PP2C family protein-serine/threonine phosphatase [Gemmataceae bacterium]|jgi:sigma-B regulation protein RsbU (phosphoserine phosphatase)|nr:PP2C family protein-serine/threonine phosphatase [Gemmataceae bacterium]
MTTSLEPPALAWQQRLSLIEETMRDMSRHTDPQEMVRAYGQRMKELMTIDRRISLSRRGLTYPYYRITRSTTWPDDVNPWKDKDRLPLLKGGLLAELIYGNETRIFDDLEISEDDPAYEYLEGHRSLLAIPMFDQGESLNMVAVMQKEPAAFPGDQVPELVWRSNLFGRATSNLVLSEELQKAYRDLDLELKTVADIQRSLLPAQLPKIPSMDLAAFYQPSRRAGGDYYDFFPLPNRQWGILIADVSGHGTPAAVLMAITHTIAHTHPGPPTPPGKLLNSVNCHLTSRYTNTSEMFVTAFYGIYDSAAKKLTYACAGHNPPRLKRCQDGSLAVLNEVNGLPLGILGQQAYKEASISLQTGDQIVFYTDGITEAHDPMGQMFGTERLDQVLENCALQASALLETILQAVEEFAAGQPASDDRTLIVARIS